MKRLIAVVAALCLATPVMAEVTADLVKEYDKMERSRTLLFKNNALYAGRTGYESEGGHFVEMFDPISLKLLHSYKIENAVKDLVEVDDCRIMASNSHGYTMINICDVTQSPTHTFGIEFVPHTGTSIGGDTVVFTEPNAGIWRYNKGRRGLFLGDNISYTNSMKLWFGRVWVTNYFNLTALDPDSGDRVELFENNEIYGFKYSQGVTTLDGRQVVMATARDDMKLVAIDPVTMEMTHALDMKGEPEGMTAIGNCVMVTVSSDKTIYFVNVAGPRLKVVGAWDANVAGDRLKMPSEIAVDQSSGTVYLRSSYPCPSCSVTQSSIFAIKNEEGIPAACMQ